MLVIEGAAVVIQESQYTEFEVHHRSRSVEVRIAIAAAAAGRMETVGHTEVLQSGWSSRLLRMNLS